MVINIWKKLDSLPKDNFWYGYEWMHTTGADGRAHWIMTLLIGIIGCAYFGLVVCFIISCLINLF